MRRNIRSRRKSQGFTLVELMVVVAIIGILAVLAVFGIRKYIANAKTAEARNALGQIGKDAVSAFERENITGAVVDPGNPTAVIRTMCASATKPVPNTGTVPAAQKYQSQKSEWEVDKATASAPAKGFACLKYEMQAAQYYMYNYTATGTNADDDTFKATAEGDLDGNGTTSKFTLNAKIKEGRLLLAPNLDELNPEE